MQRDIEDSPFVPIIISILTLFSVSFVSPVAIIFWFIVVCSFDFVHFALEPSCCYLFYFYSRFQIAVNKTVSRMSGLKQRRGDDRSTTTSTPTLHVRVPPVSTSTASSRKPVVVIVGGGPAGAAIAKSLADKDLYQVKLLEGYPHPDKIEKNSPKAYVIALGGRGQRSLQAATGIAQQQVQNSVLSHHLARHPGKKAMSIKDHPSLVVPRQALTAQLLNEAEAAGVEIHFEHKLTDIDFKQRIANFDEAKSASGDASSVVQVRYDLLIGADGSKSQVRSLLDQHADDFHVTRLEEDSMEYQVAVVETNPFLLDTSTPHPADATHVWNDKTFNSICLAFPLSTGKMLFAIVFPEGKLTEFQTSPQGYDEAFDKLLPDVPSNVKKEIAKQLSVGTPANGGTCVWSSSMGSIKHGVVLVGDSAHGE